jgi:uncharacterized protein (TIGR00730 family)
MLEIPEEDFEAKLYKTDSWRVFRIIAEFVDGFESLTKIGPSVSIFGSSRLDEKSPYYQMAVDVADKIVKRGFAVITGGGPGLMEGANKGAQASGGVSGGVCIDVPAELDSNTFIDPRYKLKFRYFFVRKVMFIRYAKACVFLPGGLGTLDELFETLTLIQTKKIHPFPIYLMGASYWDGLVDWIKKTAIKEGCLSLEDLNLFTITDDPEEVARGIGEHYTKDKAYKNF